LVLIGEILAGTGVSVFGGAIRVMLIAISGDAEGTPIEACSMDRKVIRAARQSPEPSRD
jgi:hypothetical protein